MSKDTFRKQYKPLTGAKQGLVESIKDKAEELLTLINNSSTETNGREVALAKTNLEQSIMWAVKAITE